MVVLAPEWKIVDARTQALGLALDTYRSQSGGTNVPPKTILDAAKLYADFMLADVEPLKVPE